MLMILDTSMFLSFLLQPNLWLRKDLKQHQRAQFSYNVPLAKEHCEFHCPFDFMSADTTLIIMLSVC